MTPRHIREHRRLLASALLVGSTLAAAPYAAQGPCDIYKAGGTPCVAAHSTVRALFGD